MRPRILAVASFVALALAGAGLPAAAQTTSQPAAKNDRRDTNKDGVISADEKAHARKSYAEQFRAADTNKDGGLSRDEIKAANLFPTIANNFDAMDTNRDGKVTLEERRAWGKTHQAAKKAPATTTTPSGGGLQPSR